MSDKPKPATQWLSAGRPLEFGLTTEGELTVEWELVLPQSPLLSQTELPRSRLGIVIPAEEVKILRRCLEETQTIQETLSAKEPTQGAH
jgi:hypothetical protein